MTPTNDPMLLWLGVIFAVCVIIPCLLFLYTKVIVVAILRAIDFYRRLKDPKEFRDEKDSKRQ